MDSTELGVEAFERLAAETGTTWVFDAGGWHAKGRSMETRCGRWVADPAIEPAMVTAQHEGLVAVCTDCLADLETALPATAGELLVRQFRLFYVE